MSTPHAAPADPARAPRVLRADDPAELLAQARLLYGAVVRDSLVLIGHTARRTSSLSLRSDLGPLCGPEGPACIDRLVDVLGDAGCTGAFGVVVAGDGYEAVEESEKERAIAVAARVVLLAGAHPTRAADLPEVWAIGGGQARSVRADVPGGQGPRVPGQEVAVIISDPVRVGLCDATLVAADAAFAGERMPTSTTDQGVLELRAMLAAGVGSRTARPVPRPPIGATWRAVVRALDDLGEGDLPRDPDASMSACERVHDLVCDLASRSRRDALLAEMVGRGQGRVIDSAADVIEVMARSTRRPHESVCAGGHWYRVLARVEAATRPGASAQEGSVEPILRSGWANAATLLALLAWWNCRFATAAALTDAVLRELPDHALARWTAVMADEPIVPGWGPRRSP